jgi:hypothetical protein
MVDSDRRESGREHHVSMMMYYISRSVSRNALILDEITHGYPKSGTGV